MINNITIKSCIDNIDLDVNYIIPEAKIKGLVIIAHGMSEHKERYDYFLEILAQSSYLGIVYDHRGHGKSVKEASDLGYFYSEDETTLSQDLYNVLKFFQNRYQINNTILFAHSMGTLMARSFLQKYDDEVTKVILCGPPTKNNLVDIGLNFANLSKTFGNDKKPNKFLDYLTFSNFNKPYQNKNEWLSKSKDNVFNYNNDPLCGFTFTTNGFINLYKLQKRAFQSKNYLVKNNNLPTFIIAGSDDPVIGNLKKFADLKIFFQKLGYQNITSKVYHHLRHELLQENEKDLIIKDVLDFINS